MAELSKEGYHFLLFFTSVGKVHRQVDGGPEGVEVRWCRGSRRRSPS